MKFHLINSGTCTRLKLVGEELRELLIKNRWQETKSLAEAEIVFINSCSFLKSKENEFLSLIEQTKKNINLNTKLSVFGCLPTVARKKILLIDPKILMFNRNLTEIAGTFGLERKIISVNFTSNDKLSWYETLILIINRLFLRDDGIKYRLQRDQIYHLKISDGCRGRCTYCSEKFTTAHKSRRISDVVSSFEKGLRAGYKLFALNSDDTSAFGLDNGESLFDLLQKLLSYQGDYKIAVSEFNPSGISDNKSISILSHEKIIYITIPIQSGSQKVLDGMKRPYKIKEVIEKVKELRRKNPKLKINTHIIIGFPGESEEDFQLTLSILRENIFDRVKIFRYSDRPGTEASKMIRKVRAKEIVRRANIVKRTVLLRNFLTFSISNLLLNSKTLQ